MRGKTTITKKTSWPTDKDRSQTEYTLVTYLYHWAMLHPTGMTTEMAEMLSLISMLIKE